MNSPEKVRQALMSAEQAADNPDLPAEVRVAANFVGIARPKIEALIPQDPAELDALLAKLAEWALALRSDQPAELPAA